MEHFVSKGLAMAIFILVGNWPDNIEVLMIWANVGNMSSNIRAEETLVWDPKRWR